MSIFLGRPKVEEPSKEHSNSNEDIKITPHLCVVFLFYKSNTAYRFGCLFLFIFYYILHFYEIPHQEI